jgi:hypothetical protein
MYIFLCLAFRKFPWELDCAKAARCSTFQPFVFWSFEMFQMAQMGYCERPDLLTCVKQRASSCIQPLSTAVLLGVFLTRSQIPLEYWKRWRFILWHFIRYEHKMSNVGLGSCQTRCTRILGDKQFRYICIQISNQVQQLYLFLNFKITLHVSDTFRAFHQEYITAVDSHW